MTVNRDLQQGRRQRREGEFGGEEGQDGGFRVGFDEDRGCIRPNRSASRGVSS